MSNDVNLQSLSLADLQNLRALGPDLEQLADFVLVNSYEQFITLLYQHIDDCVRTMESNRAVREKNGEERLTEDILLLLRAKGYDANHYSMISGHCDLVVCYPHKPYIWLGEAKLHGAYDDLKKGFNQLCTRYAQGTPNADADNGGLLIYIHQQKAAKILLEWQK